eukprot:scaffold944_cov333-Pavlova_lutheri.AAC.11
MSKSATLRCSSQNAVAAPLASSGCGVAPFDQPHRTPRHRHLRFLGFLSIHRRTSPPLARRGQAHPRPSSLLGAHVPIPFRVESSRRAKLHSNRKEGTLDRGPQRNEILCGACFEGETV